MADNNTNNTYTIKLKGAAIEQRLDDVPGKLNRMDDEAYRLKLAEMGSGDKAVPDKKYVDNTVQNWATLTKGTKTLKVGSASINYIDNTYYGLAGVMLYGSTEGTPELLPIGANGKILKVVENKPFWGDETPVVINDPVILNNGNAITSLVGSVDGHTITPHLDIKFTTSAEFETEQGLTVHKSAYGNKGDILYGNPGTSGPGSYGTSALGIGNPGEILMVSNSYTPVWKQESALTTVLFKNEFKAAGDILVGTGAGTLSKLSLGLNGQILKINNSAVTWGDESTLTYTPSGSGNAITDISVLGHAITATKGTTFATKTELDNVKTTIGDKLSVVYNGSTYTLTIIKG